MEVYFIFGGDKLWGLPRWSTHEALISRYHIIVLKRDGMDPWAGPSENPRPARHREQFVILDAPEGCEERRSTALRQLCKALLHPGALKKVMEVFEDA